MAQRGDTVPDTTTSAAAHLQTVTKTYTRGTDPGRLERALGRTSPPQVTALDDVSLTIENGEILGLAGPSGSGKSTLLHLLAGLITPTTGTVTVADTELTALSRRDRTQFRLTHIGVIFQQFHLLDALSAQQNVAAPLIEQGQSAAQRRKRARSLLERVGLQDRADHRPGELSGGEQQRVAIARALVTDPTLVLADEPTGELDTATGERILELFTDLAADRTVIIASHDQQTLAIADRVAQLQDGQLREITQPPVEEQL